MKKILLSIVSLLFLTNVYSQIRTDSVKLLLDFPVIDLPWMARSAQVSANARENRLAANPADVKFGDYFKYNTPSMRTLIALSGDIHGTHYYFENKLWNKWIPQTSLKKRILNRVLANAVSLPIDYGLVMLPFGLSYVHEEFHRNVMTQRGIRSYDNVWDLEGGIDIAVTRVRDADLAYLKQMHPAEQVRLSSAGTEGNYTFVRNMQKVAFFSNTDFPNALSSFFIIRNSVRYVQFPTESYYNAAVDQLLEADRTELGKDFTGYDFSAWVYDLFRPNEPYAARGMTTTGSGIKRYIKASDLTAEEFNYIEKMGNRQYMNYFSPFLLGIQNIKVNENLGFNFALRHTLTPFGDDRALDLFVNWKQHKIQFTPHIYSNKTKTFAGIELGTYDVVKSIGRKNAVVSGSVMIWQQPKYQLFSSTKGALGGMVMGQFQYALNKTWFPYVEIEAKTNGWVMGNPFLESNVSGRLGIKALIF